MQRQKHNIRRSAEFQNALAKNAAALIGTAAAHCFQIRLLPPRRDRGNKAVRDVESVLRHKVQALKSHIKIHHRRPVSPLAQRPADVHAGEEGNITFGA